jgi:hypothetical protein
LLTHGIRRSQTARTGLRVAVIADRFDRTAFHRFLAKSFFFGRLRLFIDVGMATVIVSFKIRRRRFAAQIAVDALIIYVEFAGYVLGVFVCGIGHGFSVKNEGDV